MNVVPLRAEADQSVVDFLRTALERAESGEMAFVLVIATTVDGGVIDGWSQAKTIRPYTVIGALEAAKRRFMDTEIEW